MYMDEIKDKELKERIFAKFLKNINDYNFKAINNAGLSNKLLIYIEFAGNDYCIKITLDGVFIYKIPND